MATIFQRINLIVKSNINDLLNKFEDPEKIIDQCIIDSKREYANMMKEVSEVKGNLKIEEQRLEKTQKSIAEWNHVAERAVKAGNDDDARSALKNIAAERSQETVQEAVVANCRDAAAKATKALNEFADQIKAMEMKKGELKSKAIAARSQQRANAIKSKGIASGLSKFNEMAEKIDANVATQEAMAELATTESEDENLKLKYSSPDVEDDLAALKRKLLSN